MRTHKISPITALFTAGWLLGVVACSNNNAGGNNAATAGSQGVGGGTNSAGANSIGGANNAGGATSGGGVSNAGGSNGVGGTVGTGGSIAIVDAGPLGCGSGTYAFCDDFEDGNATGWTSAEQSGSTPGDWTVATDNGPSGASTYSFQQKAVNTGHHYQYPNAPAGGPWTDQTVTAWVKPTNALGDDTAKVGVCGRVTATATSNSISGYCIFLRTDGTGTTGKLQVSKKMSGSSMASMSTSTAAVPLFAKNNWYKVKVKIVGASPVTVTGYVNDVPLIQWQEDGDASPPLTSGGPAIVTRASGTLPVTANFDDVTLTSP
jgi:hypothetical protein